MKKLLTFKLPSISKFEIINAISIIGYRTTGNKFSVNFCGSKGYLSHIEISCEGVQKEDTNRIVISEFLTKRNTLMNKTINVWHSEDSGIIITVGATKPKLL